MTLAAQSTKDSKYIHDTAKLMQNYRDVLWNVEVSEQNLQAEFRAEYGAANGTQITDLDIPIFPRSVLRTPMKFYMHLNRKAFRFLCEFTMVAARKHSKFSVPFCGGNLHCVQ